MKNSSSWRRRRSSKPKTVCVRRSSIRPSVTRGAVNTEAIEPPPAGIAPPDLDAAVANAVYDRADRVRARKDIENSQTGLTYAGNQRLRTCA